MDDAKAVLYLDVDGTVRQGKDDALGRFVNGPNDVFVFPKAIERMRQWKARGGLIVAVTNQGGVALGLADVHQVGAALVETNRQTGGLFDAMSMCVHHPQAANREMAVCWCRKPCAGAIIIAAQGLKEVRMKTGGSEGEYYPPHMAVMVGDRTEDERCAAAAKVRFMWAKDWREGKDYDEIHASTF